jgi:hypothetical protein
MPTSYRVYVDWDNNGTFVAVGDNITRRVLDQRQPVMAAYGRDTARTGSPISPGEASFAINNQSRDYSPENTASPLTGKVLPGRPVYIEAVTSGGSTYVIFRGYLDDFDLLPSRDSRSILARCVDGLGRLRGANISTSLYTGIRTGDAIGVILDAVGWPAAARSIDPGATLMPYWWLGNVDAMTAILDLVYSEGHPSLITIGSDGGFVFRDRHHRYIRAASLTAQSTWRSSGGIEPLISDPTTYDHGWKEIVNSVTYEVPLRAAASTFAVAWSAQGQITVGSGEIVTLEAIANAALAETVAPVAGTDYTVVSGSVNITLNRSTGQVFSLRIASVGGPAVIDGLQLRGRTVDTITNLQVTVEDTASIASYGRRTAPDGQAPVWAGRYDAQAVGEILVGRRAERLPTVTTTIVGSANATRLTQALARELSDRVRVTESHTGLDSDCFVEKIAHTIGQGGTEHRTTFALEKAPTEVATPLTFDVAGRGFNDGRFQVLGVSSAASMFRFDTASRGFNDGAFSY